MRSMVKNEDIDKWIEFVEAHVGRDELLLDLRLKEVDQNKARPNFELIEAERDSLLKLHEFLEKTRNSLQPPNYIGRLLHRSATFHLIRGDSVSGIVDGFDNHEIRIKKYNGDDVLIFKHAVVLVDGDFSRQGKGKKEDKSAALYAARDYLINLDEQMKEIGEYDQKTAHDIVKKIDAALSG